MHRWGEEKQQKAAEKWIDSAYFVYTSNVDGHWQRVVPQDKLLEIHGWVSSRWYLGYSFLHTKQDGNMVAMSLGCLMFRDNLEGAYA